MFFGCETTEERETPSEDVPEQTEPELIDGSSDFFSTTTIQPIQIQLSDENHFRLNDDPLLEEYVPGNVSLDGEEMENVGVRYKGRGVFVELF